MKVVDFLDGMNKRVSIKTARLIELKTYYVCMYRAKMVELYDAGYISDPTRFNDMEIRTNIVDMDICGFTSVTGNIVLDMEHAEYALYKNRSKENRRVSEFLRILYDVIKYREYCADVNHFYDENGFAFSNRSYAGMGIKSCGAKFECRTSYGVSRAIVSCFLKKGMTAMEMSFGDKIWDLAMSKLGIPENEWHEDGLIDADLTHAEEVRCIHLLLEGMVFPSGKYKYSFQDWLQEHKWKIRGMTTSCKGLYSYLFSSCSTEIFEIEGRVLNSLHDKGIRVYAMDGCKYYVAKPIKKYNIPMGCFVVEGGVDEVLFDGAVVSGYTGEVYSEEYLLAEEISYLGCPMELYISPKEKALFYDIEQVDIRSDTWFKVEELSIDFYDDIRDVHRISKIEGMKGKVLELYQIYRESFLGKLVGTVKDLKDLESSKQILMKNI